MTAAKLEDITARNAGAPTLSVWADGTFILHGARDAEICDCAENPAPVLHIDAQTWEPVTFLPMQARVDLFEKIATLATVAAANDEGGWKPIAEFDMANVGPTRSVIVAVTCEGRDPVVGEAYFDEGAYGGTWWWAGLSQDGYYDSHIEDMQHGKVTHFHPMPTFPAIRLLSQGGGK